MSVYDEPDRVAALVSPFADAACEPMEGRRDGGRGAQEVRDGEVLRMTVYDIDLITIGDELREYLKYFHELNEEDRTSIVRELMHIARNNIK